MALLSHVRFIDSGKDHLDTGISDLEIRETDEGTFLYSSSGAYGGLASYALHSNGTTILVDTQFYTGTLAELEAGEIDLIEIAGTSYAITGMTSSDSLVGLELGEDGDILGKVSLNGFSRHDGALSAVVSFEAGNDSFLFSAEQGGAGIDGYEYGSRAVALTGGSVGDTATSYVSDVTDLTMVTVGQSHVVLALGGSDHGISSFLFNPSNGKLTSADNIGADEGLGIHAPQAIETLKAFGATYAVVAASGTSSLSVLKVDANGALTVTDHVNDSLHTRFSGASILETVVANGRVFVFAAGGDDGLSVFTLLPSGQLQHIETVAQTQTNGLGNVSAIAADVVGGNLRVFVSSQEGAGISEFVIDIGDLGATTNLGNGDDDYTGTDRNDLVSGGAGDDVLRGGRGDDILADGPGSDRLVGGAGRDLFVFTPDGDRDEIRDFTPGVDRIDLSAFPMLFSPSQLAVTPTDYGARVVHGDDVLLVYSNSGRSLSQSDLFGAGFNGPTRSFSLQPEIIMGSGESDYLVGSFVVDEIFGSDGDDHLEGNDGSDRLAGGPGNDDLFGGNHADLLFGGAGSDKIDGGDGDDKAWGGGGADNIRLGDGNDEGLGGEGNDTLFGNHGEDELRGGNGNDRLYAGAHNDIAFGDDGDDSVFGGAGDDRLSGGPGRDELVGGAGNDTLIGNGGPDEISGGPGGDRGFGGGGHDSIILGPGNDLLRGGAGNDRLVGGAGNDKLIGGPGNDAVFGGNGSDTAWLGEGDDTYRDSKQTGDKIRNWVSGGDGNDKIFGGWAVDVLLGNSGRDWLKGFGGRDRLVGGSGADRLEGHGGNDRLVGNGGNDRLDGGRGADMLIGGPGADVFIFRANDGRDRIRDFEDGTDTIRFKIEGLKYSDLTFSKIDGGVSVDYGSGTILLPGLALVDLDKSDFDFG